MSSISSTVNHVKHAPAVDGVLPVFHRRWSARSFSEQTVSAEDLKRVFEAARWSPSANNEQPWRFIVGRIGSETHTKLTEALMGFNKGWASTVPVLILGIAKSTFSHKEMPNPYALYDLGAATGALVVQAAELGLNAHQMAGFDQEAARKALGIPEEFAIGVMTALGYADEPEKLGNETLIERELAPRTRKDLSEIVLAAWEEPAPLA